MTSLPGLVAPADAGRPRMRTVPIQLLTWGTVSAAVGSAAWLSATDQKAVFCSVGYRATSNVLGIDDMPLPLAPTGAGRARVAPGAGSSGPTTALAG
jgi:hypothetical protein